MSMEWVRTCSSFCFHPVRFFPCLPAAFFFCRPSCPRPTPVGSGSLHSLQSVVAALPGVSWLFPGVVGTGTKSMARRRRHRGLSAHSRSSPLPFLTQVPGSRAAAPTRWNSATAMERWESRESLLPPQAWLIGGRRPISVHVFLRIRVREG